MKLQTKYILFVSLLHLVALVLSWFIFKEDKIIFIASEALILVSAFISWQLYNEMIAPLKTLMQGVEAIKDRDFNVKFLPTGKFEMDQLIEVYNNMIDHLREERIKQEEQHFFLEKLIYTSPTGILILDYDEKVKQVNPKGCALLGVEEKELVGKAVKEISLPVLQEITTLPTGESKTITLNGINTYKIQKSHFIDRGFPRYFVMMEELTTEILAAEKKAYGKVIRMMAHEVNNTIGPVNSIIESALKAEDGNGTKKENIRHALQVAVDRNQNLNLFMRNFAEVVRLPEPKKKSIDLHQLVYRIAKLMEARAEESKIHFEYQVPAVPAIISADEQQMEQVLINVIKNALEAIGSNGIVQFSSDGNKLVIRDTGKGIPPQQEEELFSPFFSTKRDGQGIGLTLVKEILLNHGFSFSLKTVAPGKTEFTIRFK
jgi:two-component system, NtrC family, nitrogen regulation sensor histidine kinase NtrY